MLVHQRVSQNLSSRPLCIGNGISSSFDSNCSWSHRGPPVWPRVSDVYSAAGFVSPRHRSSTAFWTRDSTLDSLGDKWQGLCELEGMGTVKLLFTGHLEGFTNLGATKKAKYFLEMSWDTTGVWQAIWNRFCPGVYRYTLCQNSQF